MCSSDVNHVELAPLGSKHVGEIAGGQQEMTFQREAKIGVAVAVHIAGDDGVAAVEQKRPNSPLTRESSARR